MAKHMREVDFAEVDAMSAEWKAAALRGVDMVPLKRFWKLRIRREPDEVHEDLVAQQQAE